MSFIKNREKNYNNKLIKEGAEECVTLNSRENCVGVHGDCTKYNNNNRICCCNFCFCFRLNNAFLHLFIYQMNNSKRKGDMHISYRIDFEWTTARVAKCLKIFVIVFIGFDLHVH